MIPSTKVFQVLTLVAIVGCGANSGTETGQNTGTGEDRSSPNGKGDAGSDEGNPGGSSGEGSTGGKGADAPEPRADDNKNEPPLATGGSGGRPGGTIGGAGGKEVEPSVLDEPYTPRSGSFKMLAYSVTRALRHAHSIDSGHAMLDQIAAEQGFEVVHAGQRCAGAGDLTYCQPDDGEILAGKVDKSNELMTQEGLKQFELIFHLNTSGDVFTDEEQTAYEAWMREGGAFAGTHSATDTENGWAFYSELTGQYYNGHGPQNQNGTIRFEDSVSDHPAVAGLPNPWVRREQWMNLDLWPTWTTSPGFQVLGRLETIEAGLSHFNLIGQPMAYTREWAGFRSFYTAIGNDKEVFEDPAVKKHVAGGIMWAARRGHLMK